MRTGNRIYDLGVLTVILKGLSDECLPRLLAMKRRVDNGERLSDWHIAYLERSCADARWIESLLERNPEYRDLVAGLLHLYKDIADRALENERR
jgi:hypothetical protein